MIKHWHRYQMPKKWTEKGGDEERFCDERTALRETWKELEKNGEQQQKLEGVGD